MNYFDYNANKGRPAQPTEPSKASFDVIEPPAIWVAEQEMSDDTWERVKLAAGQVA